MKRSVIESLLGNHFDQYEVAFIRERTRRWEVRDGEVYGADVKMEDGMSLRAVKDERCVFTHTFARGEEGLRRLSANAVELLPFMEIDEGLAFPVGEGDVPALSICDDEGLGVDDSEKVSRLLGMESLILKHDKRIEKARNCEYAETELSVRVVNSRGIDREAKKTVFTIFGLAVAGDGRGDEVSYYDWSWSHRLSDLDFSALAEGVASKAVLSLGGAGLPTGTYRGIISPRAAADLLQVLSASFLGESRYKKKTRLEGKEGQPCFSPLLSIVDSGLEGVDAFPFDGEGVPSRENRIVENGVFKGFVYDGYYGAKFGKASSGNAVRGGVTAPPQNGIRGIYIVGGHTDIAGSLYEGIIIDDLMGVHTANPITGEFSLGATGWSRKGVDERPFKGIIFSGNIFELLNRVQAVGNDLKFYGPAGAPSLYLEGMTISGM